MDKRVSVVMTTYNGQKYLREQMDSLREQTMPIDEVIIMDDCSTRFSECLYKRVQSERVELGSE